VAFVVIGRAPHYVWSATSYRADNIDLFAETLCGDDDVHYMYKGQCRPMTTFDAGAVKRSGLPDRAIAFHETVHGPVQGYASVDGVRVRSRSRARGAGGNWSRRGRATCSTRRPCTRQWSS
jgi:acyl-homoserine lactone acylase PvdQ